MESMGCGPDAPMENSAYGGAREEPVGYAYNNAPARGSVESGAGNRTSALCRLSCSSTAPPPMVPSQVGSSFNENSAYGGVPPQCNSAVSSFADTPRCRV